MVAEAAHIPSAVPRNRFGFCTSGGAHMARTMMLADLERVLAHLDGGPAKADEVRRAIVDENLLGRATMVARRKGAELLQKLYGLDDAIPIFRAVRALWARDPSAQPALAFLLAMARDAVLRGALPFARALAPGEPFDVKELVSFLQRRNPGRYSESTVRSVARNVASSWTQAGLLAGVMRKTRRSIPLRPVSLAMALFLGHLDGVRGVALFSTAWVGIFDADVPSLRAIAQEANRLGLLRMAAIENVVECSFPDWLAPHERRWLDEQDQAAAG